MPLLSLIKNLCIDFLFPQSKRVLELEALSPETLLKVLPRAEDLKDKHTTALFDYAHPLVKEIVWELKYSGNTRIAEKLGKILYNHICRELGNPASFESAERPRERSVLMPIPISGKRRFERGWNQSEMLTEQVLKHDEKEMFEYLPRQLVKIRHTESQTKTASRSERLRNLSNSMKVLNAASVAGKCVIVLDDVITTGSTFTEARRALRAAGAGKIICVAVSH